MVQIIKGRGARASLWPTLVHTYIQHATEDHKVMKRRDSHIFHTIGSEMAVRLSALRSGRPLLSQEDTSYSFLLEAESTPGP
jgi:hypothetical protein